MSEKFSLEQCNYNYSRVLIYTPIDWETSHHTYKWFGHRKSKWVTLASINIDDCYSFEQNKKPTQGSSELQWKAAVVLPATRCEWIWLYVKQGVSKKKPCMKPFLHKQMRKKVNTKYIHIWIFMKTVSITTFLIKRSSHCPSWGVQLDPNKQSI